MTYPTNQIPSINPQNIAIATPVGLQSAPRDPNAQDNTFVPGSEWQNTVSKVFWKCVSSTIAGAVWIAFVPSSAGTVATLTGNSGGAVGPFLGNINVFGDGSTINIAGNPGTNTLTASLVGGGVASQSYTTNIPGPVFPTGAGVVNLNASTSTYTDGSVANTVKIELQGTDHALFVGKGVHMPASTIPVGTNGQVLLGATGADPAFGTLTSSAGTLTYTTGANTLNIDVTAPLNIAYGGTASTTFNTNGVVISGTTPTSPLTALSLTDGQVVIGSTIGPPAAATLTAGTGITITNGHNSITIAASGTVVTETLTGDSGGPIAPVAGNINLFGNTAPATTGLTFAGSGNTLALGGDLVVANGGTGNTTFTAFSVLCAGTTATGSFQNVSGLGTLNQVLVSQGAGALPQWKSIAATTAFDVLNIQTFKSSGTYTPTTGMQWCLIECVGGGGGGGGCAAAGSLGSFGGGAGGGSGGYSKLFASAATIGASKAVTIGAGGGGGASGDNTGTGGGATSVGVLCVANGGSGGTGSSGVLNNASGLAAGGAGGTIGTGTFVIPGQTGFSGVVTTAEVRTIAGGNSVYGPGAPSSPTLATMNGPNAISTGFGGGGGGGLSAQVSGTAAAGGSGTAGVVIVTEFISS